MRRDRRLGERGATRVEAGLGAAVIIIIVGLGIAIVTRGALGFMGAAPTTAESLGHQHPDSAPSSQAADDALVAVSVVEAATIAEPMTDDDADACPLILGRQPTGFDCILPLYVDALENANAPGSARYSCVDAVNYQVVGGQEPSANKQCVLVTAARAAG